MAEFINIEGTLINLDNVVEITLNQSGELLVIHNTEELTISTYRTTTAHAAYEFLKTTCVATFESPRDPGGELDRIAEAAQS